MMDDRRVLSSCTRKDTTGHAAHNSVIAIFECASGAERGRIGIAHMGIGGTEIFLSQFVDNASYTLLKVRLGIIGPKEILLPQSSMECVKVLRSLLETYLPNTEIKDVRRRFFNDSDGIKLVQRYGVEGCSHVMEKYEAMAACAALIMYMEHVKDLMFMQNSLRITYEALEDTCLIDVNSWVNLDLISTPSSKRAEVAGSGNKPEEPRSLYDVLNSCVTIGGRRALKMNLLQPSANLKDLNARLDVVEELVTNQAMLDRVRQLISPLGDLQQLVVLCAYKSKEGKELKRRSLKNKITQAVELQDLLETVDSLVSVLANARENTFFREGREKLMDKRLEKVANMVERSIDARGLGNHRKRRATDASFVQADDPLLMAVRSEENSQLNISRRVYQELLHQIEEVADREKQLFPGAELAYTTAKGYHYSIASNTSSAVTLSSQCINVAHKRKMVTFTTRHLIKQTDRLRESEDDILNRSAEIVDHMISKIRNELPAIYNCIEFISLLDFYAAMAIYASKVPTVRPVFGTSLCVKAARHPILDVGRRDIVPNNIRAESSSRFTIVAGPNMAGKSTYLRTVCLVQILAQMGCLVPADVAQVVPMNRIFSRCGHGDNLQQGLSAFALEMQEMGTILMNSNRQTLIVVDELARSTGTEEGVAMCYAICEELLALGPYVFFATHFLNLSALEFNYPAVKSVHFSAATEGDEQGKEACFKAKHVLVRGAYTGPLYGLELAKLTTLPEEIITNTVELATQMREESTNPQEVMENDEEVQVKALALLARRILSLM